jgi:outer membrane lipoprotein-sorting protein
MYLLLAAALLQDQTAEETFKKIENLLAKAETASVRYKCEAIAVRKGREADNPVKSESSGLLLIKKGNKLRLSTDAPGEERITILSNGVEIEIRERTVERDDAPPRRATPKELATSFATATARVGIAPAQLLYTLARMKGDELLEEMDFVRLFEVSDFKPGEAEKDLKSIRFRFKAATKRAETIGEATLWYDPVTYKPVKRTMSFDDGIGNKKKPSSIVTLTETYAEFTLNTDIPEDKFKLPPEK